MALSPTLIVGLGGVGSKIVAKIAERIDEKQHERINFVVLDTDVNELGRIERESSKGIGKKVKTVQTSTNMTVGDYLHLDEFTRDNSFPVNPNLYRKTLSEGAGQVRAISHLAFVTAMKRGLIAPLDDAIYDLYKLESVPTTQVLKVIIVSTLAGGTGSGLILPVSMYIKQFLKTKIQIPGSITRGFFILPEILYGAVMAEPMRNAFKANAYAVIRELNAFILKADGNLDNTRYKNKVHLMFPKVGTKDFEEYDVLPLDFCFMFDAQNIEGKKLNSTEQYFDHAANCIYAQSIGPMNTRSNSSEDNVIRTLVSGQSRNRYAGAGASELIYPSDHILRYIALKWTTQTVSEHWTVFDREIEKEVKENNKARLRGQNVHDIDFGKEYITKVDSAAENDNAFALLVRSPSYTFDKDGFTETGNKWTKYADELQKFVQRRSASHSEMDNSRDTSQGSVEALTSSIKEQFDIDLFRTAYTNLINYKETVKRGVKDIGRSAANEIFKYEEGEDITATEKSTQIETYMKNNKGDFMHPNAARYFLYQTLQMLHKKYSEAQRKINAAEQFFKEFDTMFDDPDTDTVEGIGDFIRKVEDQKFWERIRKKYEGSIKDHITKYETLLTTIADYRVTAPYFHVLSEAIKYITKMCEAYQSFYQSFESNVKDIEKQIVTSEEKYSIKKGNAVRYVCTSKKCLDKFYEKMQFTGNAIQIPSDLCRQIYRQVRASKFSTEVNKTTNFFKDIFDKEILQYFSKTIMDTYSSDIKMDIIQALEVEAEFEAGLQERIPINEYVIKVIEDTKKLSDPFINRPVGEEPVPIDACAFNKKLYGVEDPERKNFVYDHLKSFGGVECEDDEMPEERVLFYRAIYGLFPYDLLKFAPPHKGMTVSLEAGEYNRAYYDMISRIEPDTQKTPVITPHLHKHWHLISEMPDLSEKLQREQEKAIYKALTLGLLYDMIRYEKRNEKLEEKIYGLWLNEGQIQLIVSNGTPCDVFYEIIDALTINPVIVKKINKAVESIMETSRMENIVKFENSELCKGLKDLKLAELSGDDRVMSIFGIAAAYKATTPPDEFNIEQGQILLETILETLYEQIEKLCQENERSSKYSELIIDQLNLFVKNSDLYREKHPSVIDDYMRTMLQVVIKVLHEKGLYKAKEKVNELSKQLFSGSSKPSSKNMQPK